MVRSTISRKARGTVLVTLASLGILAVCPTGHTAGPRPLFQMPVPCGQVWEASTYKGHWNGEEDAIDLAQRDQHGNNISAGEPVLASADGIVDRAYTASNGEHRVFLDHGDGWATHYIHLEEVPPKLAKGDFVAQGEQIGRTWNSGIDNADNEDMHIHYNQVKDGTAVRVSFDGELIDTHMGNKSSYNTYGHGEKLLSRNCSGNSFLQFTQNGQRFEFVTKPGTGDVNIVRLSTDGTDSTNVMSDTWTRGWTHHTPFTLVGGQQHLFSYKSSTGRVRFARFTSGGTSTYGLWEGTWGKSWTHFVPFSRGGYPYFIAYDSLDGSANIERVNGEGSRSSTVSSGTWTTGWTHLVQYDLNSKSYLLLYKGGTGEAKVVQITGSANEIDLTEVWSGTWTRGWTHLVPLVHKGARHLLGYKAASGKVKYMKFASGGQGIQSLAESTWTTGWTTFTPYHVDGHAYVRLYKTGTGSFKSVELNDAGTSMTTRAPATWGPGWA